MLSWITSAAKSRQQQLQLRQLLTRLQTINLSSVPTTTLQVHERIVASSDDIVTLRTPERTDHTARRTAAGLNSIQELPEVQATRTKATLREGPSCPALYRGAGTSGWNVGSASSCRRSLALRARALSPLAHFTSK